jgi:hypothetical protein
MKASEIKEAIDTQTKTTTHLRNVGRALSLLGFEKVQVYKRDLSRQVRGYWVKEVEEAKAPF